ncbi:E3 ubiquitin-protein ligase hrd-like protein 1 [Argiope bruennichi]|uniref:E3 ubiquitin-protein ligase hrd-like protein 1 n=1 Tax=Argiope bruennichi TaxID=94029 RepID=UPI0024954305|nr:E3 ubiquitin-protein ligase hrd-like protein 1 [Argiope bruennichi]XP_055942032.1 E3 ubiquitin-protein ligase hrd-like protein 1 [Argiope bruennichi]
MSFSEYIQTVRAVLESLSPPEIVSVSRERENFRRKLIAHMAEITKHHGWYMPSFTSFILLDASVYSVEFQELAKSPDGFPWAVWKIFGINHLIDMAMTVYFQGIRTELEQWQKMGELVLESIYSSYCSENCFKRPADCSICTRPLYHETTTTCGHKFHVSCLEKWMLENTTCPLCRYEL